MAARYANGGHGRTNTSYSVKKAELASAYNTLATELTQHEIKSIGPYSLGRVIGQGSFGKVRLGVHRLTNTRVAIKQVPKSLPSNSGDPSSPLSLLTREIHHHRRLRHSHVLALYEIIATETNIYLVSELCTGGELFDYLIEKERLSTSEVRRIGGQLVLGLHYLHSRGVVHRDLKLENILLDEHVNVKIADLGFGREFEKGRLMETWVGTLGYCAPEIVAAQKYHGEAVDVWSLGVILYSLLVGSLPFDDDDEAVMRAAIVEGRFDIPPWLDDDSAQMLKSILVVDPLKRPSLVSILDMPFFTRSSPPPMHISPTPSTSVLPIAEEHVVNGSVVLQPTLGGPRLSSDSSDSEMPGLPRLSSSGSGRKRDSASYLGPPPTMHSPSLNQAASAPPMSRNMSASSGVSVSSIRSHVASPSNARTPSRTKRRSVSSVLSERKTFNLDHDDEWIDWRERLLQDVQTESSSFLQDSSERDLMDRLTSLGFDAGQLKHSVTTNACDSVAATWWILYDKKKRQEDRQLAKKQSRDSNLGDVFEAHADFPRPSAFDTIEESPTAPKAPKFSPIEATSISTRNDYFVLPTSISMPSLSQYGSMPPSPSKATGEFYDHDRTPMPLTLSLPPSGSVPDLSTTLATPDSPSARTIPGPGEIDPSSPRKRTRSGSQSVLARASAALGNSLNRVKSEEHVGNPLSLSTSGLPGAITTDGRLSPSAQLASLFTRKGSVGTLTEQSPTSPMKQSISLHDLEEQARAEQPPPRLATPSSDQPSSDHASTAHNSPVPSSSTPRAVPEKKSGTERRKANKSSIFSNFRQWFAVDGQKKAQRKRNTIDASNLSRSGSYRSPSSRAPSTVVIKRPSTSRRSSTSSLPAGHFAHVAPVSRRSSMSSSQAHRSHRPSPHIGPRRRPSDSSVPSVSDRENSRPSSATSLRGNESRPLSAGRRNAAHHKTGSFSSASSGRTAGLSVASSPKDVYRRPPTYSTVRRMHPHGHQHGHHHHRNSHSGARSSSSSTGEDDPSSSRQQQPPAFLEDVDEEDVESVKQAERSKALSKLSGDWADIADDQEPSSSPPATSSRPPLLERFHSRDSDFSQSSSSRPHSPVIFAVHRSHHVFGAPSQPSPQHSTLHSNLDRPQRPPLRDVFSSRRTTNEQGEEEWVDEEDDDLFAYTGGVGQRPLSKSAGTSNQASSRPSVDESARSGVEALNDSPLPAVLAQESWRTHMPRSNTFRRAVPITEEEEEEDL